MTAPLVIGLAYYRNHPELRLEKRAALNHDHPNALETDVLVRHVDALRAGRRHGTRQGWGSFGGCGRIRLANLLECAPESRLSDPRGEPFERSLPR
jgi:hypothetical protein